MRSSTRRLRAEHAVEDALAVAPAGMATMALTDRLARAGLTPSEASDFLRELRDQGSIVLDGGRWRRAR